MEEVVGSCRATASTRLPTSELMSRDISIRMDSESFPLPPALAPALAEAAVIACMDFARTRMSPQIISVSDHLPSAK